MQGGGALEDLWRQRDTKAKLQVEMCMRRGRGQEQKRKEEIEERERREGGGRGQGSTLKWSKTICLPSHTPVGHHVSYLYTFIIIMPNLVAKHKNYIWFQQFT